ncbi:YqaA family protein [Salinisphaera orenii]|uniref:YqaA family protein n=1 Tax=Salinisphaera orenii TaxID=856731 RepID=UPI00195503E0
MWRRLYDWVVAAAGHRHAPRWLAVLAFTEACVFPIPPEAMLAPMTLARPRRGWHYALLATLASTAGGLVGYAIGMWFIDVVQPALAQLGYLGAYHQAQAWFSRYGVLIVVLAGFTPIPYKVFTIAAGVAGMIVAPFVLASLVGRGLRFGLVAGLVIWLGPAFEAHVLKYINWIGWCCLVAAILSLTGFVLA